MLHTCVDTAARKYTGRDGMDATIVAALRTVDASIGRCGRSRKSGTFARECVVQGEDMARRVDRYHGKRTRVEAWQRCRRG